MANTNITTPDIDKTIKAVNDLVEELSLKFYNLSKLTEMVAFACEARRMLDGLTQQAEYFPDFKKHISESLHAPNDWMTFDDVTSDVLRSVSQQITNANTELNEGTQCARDLHDARAAPTA